MRPTSAEVRLHARGTGPCEIGLHQPLCCTTHGGIRQSVDGAIEQVVHESGREAKRQEERAKFRLREPVVSQNSIAFLH